MMSEHTSTPPLLYGMVKLLEATIAAGKEDKVGTILEAMRTVGASPEKLATIQVVAYFRADNMEKARSILKEVRALSRLLCGVQCNHICCDFPGEAKCDDACIEMQCSPKYV